MNNYVIPSVVLSTVLIALAISVAPIQEASAVHTTIIDDIVDQEQILSFRISSVGAGLTNAVLVPDRGVDLTGSVSATIVAGAVAITLTDDAGNTLVTDANGGVGDVLAVTAIAANDQGIELTTAGAATVDVVIYLNTFPQV